jgi:NAD(P)-dependent dehydrogenase (short-subunit alcohol dehydrogenase family)
LFSDAISWQLIDTFLDHDSAAGAGSGIGVETARALSSKGAHVVLAVRNMEAGEATKADILKGSPKAQVRGDTLGLRGYAFSAVVQPFPSGKVID